MSAAAQFHAQLLEQARHLAVREPRRPRQASLRRSISASYYALFHFLVGEATGLLVGTAASKRHLRQALARTFGHREMSDASRRWNAGLPALPDSIRSGMVDQLPAELTAMAKTFWTLQQERHNADYDLSKTLCREDALELVTSAETAIESWIRIRGNPATEFYLISLLAWNRLSGR